MTDHPEARVRTQRRRERPAGERSSWLERAAWGELLFYALAVGIWLIYELAR